MFFSQKPGCTNRIYCYLCSVNQETHSVMKATLTKSNYNTDDESVPVVNEAEEKYISSKEFFDLLRKEVNSHYDNI